MKRIAVFGSTGSIGQNLIDLVRKNQDRYQLVLLACNRNVQELVKQLKLTGARRAHILDESATREFSGIAPLGTLYSYGDEPIADLLDETRPDLVVNAIVGTAGLEVSYHTLNEGITLALANKESLVAAGELLKRTAERTGAMIIPIDSEHSALLQCLLAGRKEEVEKLILTSSGGPFRTRPIETFGSITVAEALKHPNWNMGRKITIDSATLMNKGLEVIEAHFLFDLPPEQIEVVVHPQSIVHSMVQFRDGAIMAQLSPPDMRLPLSYALAYPERLPTNLPRLPLDKPFTLEFEPPDREKFPALELAYQALRKRGVLPLVLNAANEVAVEAFLAEQISFSSIPSIIEKTMAQSVEGNPLSLKSLLEADQISREKALAIVEAGTLAST